MKKLRKKLKIGIMSREEFQRYTLAIAKGEIKPKPGTPKVWFESVESMAQILSTKNRALLRIIREKRPQSLGELQALSGREKASLSRTLSKMAEYGLVELAEGPRNSLIPMPVAESFEVAPFI